MSESTSKANRYRWEATEIRRAAEIVQDERFREQLLSIADEYDAAATEIEAQLAGGSHK
jgi:pyruvate-formate lyase